MREHDEGNSHKVPRLRDKLKAENQQEKFVEVEGLGPKCSKWIIERGTDLQNFEILDVQIVYVLEHQGQCYSKGEGIVIPQFWPHLH